MTNCCVCKTKLPVDPLAKSKGDCCADFNRRCAFPPAENASRSACRHCHTVYNTKQHHHRKQQLTTCENMSDRGCCQKQTCANHLRDWLLHHTPASNPEWSSDEIKTGIKKRITTTILLSLVAKGYFANFRQAFSYATDSVRADAQKNVTVFPTTSVDEWEDFLWWLKHSSPAPTFLLPACLKAITLFYNSTFRSPESKLMVGHAIVRRVFQSSKTFLEFIKRMDSVKRTWLVHGRKRRADDPVAEFVLTYTGQ